MKIFSILAFLLPILTGHLSVFAQNWQYQSARGDNFYDIQKQTDDYYSKHGAGKGSGIKPYTRWARWMSPRIYPTGELINTSAIRLKEYQEVTSKKDDPSSRSTHGFWEDLGPFDYYSGGGGSALGRVNRISFHPSLTDEFWVGTAAGGLWKTNDGGTTWVPRTDGLPSIGVSGICIHPNSPSIQYLLTGDGDGGDAWSVGVLKSTDNGFTWNTTGLTWGVSSTVGAYNLVMKPDDPATLLVASSAGLWISSDGATNWTAVDTTAAVYWDIEFAPGNSMTVYASSNEGLLISSDGGMTWSPSPDASLPAAGTYTRIEIAVSPSNAQTVYLLYGGGPTGFAGLYKSTDFGVSFTLMSNTPNIMGPNNDGSGTAHQAWYDIALAVDPANDATIYVGGINVWKSTDSGMTWTLKTDWRRIVPFIAWIHADIHELQFRGSTLYACNDGGVFKSDDGGDNWTELSAGLSIMQFYYIDIHENDYVGGTQDNGTNGANVTNPQTTNILDGDGFAAIYHSGNSEIQYLTNQNNKVRRQSGTNSTITPAGITPNGSQFLFWDEDMDMHTADPDFVFIANWELYKGNGDFFSFSWDSMYTTFACTTGNGCRITTISQGIDNDDIMYISNEQEILKTSNINDAIPMWTSLTLPTTGAVTDILVDPADANRIWVSFSGYIAGQKLYFSPDGGGTWFNQTGSLPNVPANCMIYQAGPGDNIYLGTDIGVFYRNAGIGDWIYFGNGLPNTPVTDLDIEGNYLYAGTHGRGLWRTDLYSPCPVNLTLTTANNPGIPFSNGTQEYHASNAITTTRILNGGVGTQVLYHAGNYIDMKVGFWAKAGNFMEANIEGCPD